MAKRSYSGVITLVAAMALLCALGVSSAAAAGDTTLVSVDSSEAQTNADSFVPSVSSDGRYVAFTSHATNLVAGDTNAANDVFVRDRTLGTTERASVDSSGNQANRQSGRPYITSDGRYVVFYSEASNLVAGDTNSRFDVFVRDRQAGTTERVSLGNSGNQANGYSLDSYITSDGRYVVFRSGATNLVAGDTNGQDDVFVRDRQAGTTERVSVDSSGNEAIGGSSFNPSISDDGNLVAFPSGATNLVTGDTNGLPDVFVRDRQAGTTERVSVDSSGNQANGQSFQSFVSEDGHHVLFNSGATNLVPDDTNQPHGTNEAFVHDLQSGKTERVGLGNSGNQADNGSNGGDISSDGRYVAFSSSATNLVAGDTNGQNDVFVRDRQAGTTERVSVNGCGTQANDRSDIFGNATISDDGRYVAFSSSATNLVAGDTNGVQDAFLYDRGTQPEDCIAPSTTASATTGSGAPYTSGAWTNENVEMAFSARDDEGGSGVLEIRYSATGAQSTPETVYDAQDPPVIDTEGDTTISYFATDNAGNPESPSKTFTVRIDKSAPDASITSGPSGPTSVATPTFSFGGSDNLTQATSLLFSHKVVADGVTPGSVPWSEYSLATSATLGGATGLADGSYTFYVKVKDQASNEDASPVQRSFTVDTTRPTVRRTVPIADTTGVAPGANVSVFFSEAMREASVNANTLKLFQKGAAAPIEAQRAYDAELKKAVLNPDVTLKRGATYRAVVTTGVRDLAGNRMEIQKAWFFTIRR